MLSRYQLGLYINSISIGKLVSSGLHSDSMATMGKYSYGPEGRAYWILANCVQRTSTCASGMKCFPRKIKSLAWWAFDITWSILVVGLSWNLGILLFQSLHLSCMHFSELVDGSPKFFCGTFYIANQLLRSRRFQRRVGLVVGVGWRTTHCRWCLRKLSRSK